MGNHRKRKHEVRQNTGLTRHHRLPRSQGGKGIGDNIVMLPANIHKLWHEQWYNLTPCEIARQICIVFFGFSEYQMKDVRVENFLDMVSSITEAKDRRV